MGIQIDDVERAFLGLSDHNKVTAYKKLHSLLKKLESARKYDIGAENVSEQEIKSKAGFGESDAESEQTNPSQNGLVGGDMSQSHKIPHRPKAFSRRKERNRSKNTSVDVANISTELPNTSELISNAGLYDVNAITSEMKPMGKKTQEVRRGNRKRKVTAKLLESAHVSKDSRSDTEDGAYLFSRTTHENVEDNGPDEDDDETSLVVDTSINIESGRKRKKTVPAISSKKRLGLHQSKKKISRKFFSTNSIKKKYSRAVEAMRKCSVCEETFQGGASFQKHLESHGDASVCCKHCKNEFLNPASLGHHRCPNNVETNWKGPKLCRVCGEEFHNVRDLHHHMRTDHNLKSREPSYFCKFCRRGFVKRVSMYLHYKDHADADQMVCSKCGTFCDSFEDYSKHMEEHSKEAPYSCERCAATFANLRNYQMHMAGHDKYKCTECDQSFASRRRLEIHCRKTHGTKIKLQSKVFECLYCHKKFGRPGQRDVHVRIHTGERPIECSVCNMFFRTSKALFKHRNTRTHLSKSGQSTKDRAFLCSECGRSYYRKQALQRHMKYHLDDDKPHICPHCGYRCRESNNLKRHISLHFEGERNFVCEVCGSSFHAKKTLEMHHSYKHNSDRNFTCKLCPLSFKAANALNRHMKTHSDVKDQKCWCGTSFKRRYNLRRHMRQVHGTDEALPPPRRLKILDQQNELRQAVEAKSEPREQMENQSDSGTNLANSQSSQMTQEELFSEAARKAIQTAVSSTPSDHSEVTEGSSNMDQMNIGIQEILIQQLQVPADTHIKHVNDSQKHFTQLVPVSKESVIHTAGKDSLVTYGVGQQLDSVPVCRDHCYYNGPDANPLYSSGLLTEAVRSSSVVMASREVTSVADTMSYVPVVAPPTVTALLSQPVGGSSQVPLQNTSAQQFGGFYVGVIPQLHSYSAASSPGIKLVDNISADTAGEQRLHTTDVGPQPSGRLHSHLQNDINPR